MMRHDSVQAHKALGPGAKTPLESGIQQLYLAKVQAMLLRRAEAKLYTLAWLPSLSPNLSTIFLENVGTRWKPREW